MVENSCLCITYLPQNDLKGNFPMKIISSLGIVQFQFLAHASAMI